MVARLKLHYKTTKSKLSLSLSLSLALSLSLSLFISGSTTRKQSVYISHRNRVAFATINLLLYQEQYHTLT